MVTISLAGVVSINTLLRQAQFEQSCYHQGFQEPYDRNCQELHFLLQIIHKVAWNVLHNVHYLLEIGQGV